MPQDARPAQRAAVAIPSDCATCGVTARMRRTWNADGQAVLVSGREEQMHNKMLTTLLIAAAAIGLTGISQAQTPAPSATPAPAATPAAPLFATTARL
jgi:hypothetical protein